MKKKPKHFDGWCAFDPRGNARLSEWYRTKSDAIYNLIMYIGRGFESRSENWKRLRKEGYTVRKVKICPLGD